MEPINPSVWRRAKRNTARKVNAVRIAKGEYQGCPPRVVRGAARHPSMASSENHTVKLPRWRRLASYSRQFITLCFCLGIWCRRSWFSLKGKMGIRRSEKERSSYVDPARSATGRIHATAPRCLLSASRNTGDLGPGLECLGPGGSVVVSSKVIAAEVEEVVDAVVGGEEPLCLP